MKTPFFKSMVVAIVSCVLPTAVHAQRANPLTNPPRTLAPAASTNSNPSDVTAQIAELRSAIARLESSITASQQQTPAASGGMKGMGGMKSGMMGKNSSASQMRGGMTGGATSQGAAAGMKSGMMDDDMGEMPPASGGAMPGGMESMDSEEMGMGPMGQQGVANAGGLQASSLPGFPGASHIYHIGATGFFLDHPEHITLETAQQQELNRLKQNALLAKASTQRKVNEAEQQLWELTGADQPDADQIQAKVEEIAKLRGQQRLEFIRAVGESAKILTDEQRQVLLGLRESGPPSDQAQNHQAHSRTSK